MRYVCSKFRVHMLVAPKSAVFCDAIYVSRKLHRVILQKTVFFSSVPVWAWLVPDGLWNISNPGLLRWKRQLRSHLKGMEIFMKPPKRVQIFRLEIREITSSQIHNLNDL
jgi:hypothetical protein